MDPDPFNDSVVWDETNVPHYDVPNETGLCLRDMAPYFPEQVRASVRATAILAAKDAAKAAAKAAGLPTSDDEEEAEELQNESFGGVRVSLDVTVHPPGQAASTEGEPVVTKPAMYERGQMVFARDGDRIYEAKIISVSLPPPPQDNGYYVHYVGWADRWNAWVLEPNLMPINDETRALKEKSEFKAPKKRVARQMEPEEKEEWDAFPVILANRQNPDKIKAYGDRRRFRMDMSRDVDPIGEETKPTVKIPLPANLRRKILDDWEFLTQQPRGIVPLPRTPNVSQIFETYLKYKKESGGKEEFYVRTQELMDGLELYFNKALGKVLLYRRERDQYNRLLRRYNDKEPAELFGAEHLLRLFVRLPVMLSETPLRDEHVTQIQGRLGEFLNYLDENRNQFFLKQYKLYDKYLEELKDADTANVHVVPA